MDPVVVDISGADTGNCVGDGGDDVMTTLAAGDDVAAYQVNDSSEIDFAEAREPGEFRDEDHTQLVA